MQLTLDGTTALSPVVNVASVPQRSPFRYPGGKSWLIPRIRQWFASLPEKPSHLIEPFAGGASVGLTAGFENLCLHVSLIELDDDVASVWETILEGDAVWLAHQLRTFQLTPESVRDLLACSPSNRRERAFRTLVRNRVNHGGVLAPGVGMLKTGENGKGILSRWYPETLARRVEDIAARKKNFCFFHMDGLEAIQDNLSNPEAVFFIDPPYTFGGKNAGSRLYLHNAINHENLFQLASQVQGHFLLTYDNTEDAKFLARKFGFETREIAMKNTHHSKLTEVLISRDLSWIHT